MDHASYSRPPRRVLGDASSRANEDMTQRRRAEKHGYQDGKSSPNPLPHNESLVPDGSLAVRNGPPHGTQPSPQNKRLSAVINEAVRPHNPKRDSTISNASTNSNRKRQTHIGPWQLGKTIGEGGCSRVRIVRHSVTGELGAAKIISRAMADKVRALSLANLIECAETDESLQIGGDSKFIPFGLEREICIMKLLDHPNIVRLHDIWENRNELYLIMEYVEGGELLDYIGKQGIQEIEVVHLFRQIIAALVYCHRLYIHHRDLKPENILLDKHTFQIKLVDFGMAALQPLGSKLTTPCGSPHYAAPEVIKTTSYDGAKADIWSCGVILYVMLTGSPPFNYNDEQADLNYLFRCIARAEYTMPDNLSVEAQDLIRRILVPDPRRRISIEDIWNHPFLHKYDTELGFGGEKATLEYWVGPSPCIVGWKPLDRHTIDREIFRYLRTLWHSESEEALMHRLMSKESNQEKYFYSVLVKYRNEQLEDYTPGLHTVAHSTSDHHHVQRPPNKSNTPGSENKHKRSRSAYSILNNEHMYSKHSMYAPPSSDASYDPFRASRDPLVPVPTTSLNHNITVNRGSDAGSRKLRPTTALGHRSAGSSLRVRALRNNSNRQSSVASGESRRGTLSARSQRSVATPRRSVSRSSMASSHWPSSPPVIVRPGSSMGRRGVSFSHLRRNSATSGITARTGGLHQGTPEPHVYSSSPPQSMLSTPRHGLQTPTPRVVVKSAASPKASRLKMRKPESPSKYIQSEARKVSTELEKVMEEAFNRSSISSSVRTGATSKAYSEYTPPTSFANTRNSGGSNLATPKGMQNRPLPPIPDETPNTFLNRKLAETRDEIARRREQQGDSTGHFNEVLAHLDQIMLPGSNLRASSAPTKAPEHILSLPVISEEQRADGDERYGPYGLSLRAATDPLRPNLQGRRAVTEQPNTIRLVDGSPINVAPLNIRPRGSAADEPVHSFKTVQNALFAASGSGEAPKENSIKKKKSSWFRRNPEEKERQATHAKTTTGRPDIPNAWLGLDDRIDKAPANSAGPPITPQPSRQSERSTSSEFPIRNCVTTAGNNLRERKSFLGFFSKKHKEEKAKGPMEIRSDFSSSSILSGFDIAEEAPGASSGRAPEVQTNWLYRFLNIKPANKILCFQAGRGKVRQEIVRLLRDWQRFGVRDVVFDRQANTINARVDKNNHLKIKPVSLVIELFVVLQHGRRAKLCLARFTQTKGAASSFRKVVDVIEDVFRTRNMLVEDETKREEMIEVFGL